MADAIELAWAAGFFDGEGYVACQPLKRADYVQLRLKIGQTDPRVLDRFQNAVGMGKVRGPYAMSNENWNPIYEYSVQSQGEVGAVVEMLLPYLSPVKTEQCLQALKRHALATISG